MKEYDLDMNLVLQKVFKEMRKQEECRINNVNNGIKKGCENCSQWDEYWGCNKCENL